MGFKNTSWIMRQVLLALIPGGMAMLYLFGGGVLINLILAISAAIAAESLVLYLRSKPIIATLSDLSAIVTAILLALALPPTLPWWLTIIGVSFAIIIAKQLYGGLGYNLFNPAMVGYAFLLISYPAEMTFWIPPWMLNSHPIDIAGTFKLTFTGVLPTGLDIDAISAATPLENMHNGLSMRNMVEEIRDGRAWGLFGEQGWEWPNFAYAGGGIWLLYQRIITWHIPVSILGTMFLVCGIFYLLDPQVSPLPTFHLFSGATMLGAFFIATDPVTASTTPRGQLIYGSSIGLLIFIIRTWGGYPDAVAFSVLLLNTAVPLIDRYTQPRVFGTHILDDDI
ncbi:electron transporter RnfD [Achromatium sp. WMS2]|nr:electron transporter RnfD [Achromatium sp. WMS2]